MISILLLFMDIILLLAELVSIPLLPGFFSVYLVASTIAAMFMSVCDLFERKDKHYVQK